MLVRLLFIPLQKSYTLLFIDYHLKKTKYKKYVNNVLYLKEMVNVTAL